MDELGGSQSLSPPPPRFSIAVSSSKFSMTTFAMASQLLHAADD